MVPIGNVEIPVITSVTAPALKDDATEEFSLENVFLAPDDVLIIDTDVLEIQLNDENLLESWVTGGVFFSCSPETTESRSTRIRETAILRSRFCGPTGICEVPA